ncbi:MAG: hypothetical protein SVT56_03780 [Chloroflexota bacterium]|nr:hypothetical protein [Chloroflexota bacterium]
MARKTWIKIKRGFIKDPKHRVALGNSVWLYLYMLDMADWDTGKVVEWRDSAAADELQMPARTVRYQRQKIEEAGYITCHQEFQRQSIKINRWIDPRDMNDRSLNSIDGDNNLTPSDTHDDSFLSPSGLHGDNHGDNHGGKKLPPLHISHIPHVINKYRDGQIDLFQACQRIYELKVGKLVMDGYSFTMMINAFEENNVIPEDYAAAIDAMQANPKYKRATNPDSYKNYAIGNAQKRLNPATEKRSKQPLDVEAEKDRLLGPGWREKKETVDCEAK